MKRLLPCIAAAFVLAHAAPTAADVDHAALRERALSVLDAQFGTFREATGTLASTATAFCASEVERPTLDAAFQDAWRAWAPLDSYQFGPVEQLGAALSIDFWPDKKNFVGRALAALQDQPAEAQADPATVAAGSAAAQGFPALERLLYAEPNPCPAAVGIAAHLDGMANALYAAWFDPEGWAALMRAAGPDNPVYLSDDETTRTLLTAVDFGLERAADYRLGRPLGTYERSFPRRAEAWRSGLSAELASAQIAGAAAMVAEGFGPALPAEMVERFEQTAGQAEDRLAALDQTIAEAVADPASRIRVEAVQTQVQNLRELLDLGIAPALGVETGFSAADGD